MKNKETINQILKKIRNNLTPSKGQTTSIDPKKMARVVEDVEVAKEINKNSPRPADKDKNSDKDQ
jgi:hypothetical protein